MLDRIVVAVDGSENSLRAAAVGAVVADVAGAAVDVVHVEPTDASDAGQDPQDVLAPAVERLDDAGVDHDDHVLEGDPAPSIVAFADDRDADLVVLGRRGLGGVRDRLLGSVVHAVLRNTDRSVLAVPEGAGPIAFDDLLVPTDGSEAAEAAAPVAALLADQHGATVHSCYVLDLATEAGAFSAGGVTEAEVERLEARGRDHLERLADRLREEVPNLTIRTSVVRDEPHEGIAEYVAEAGIDLVVLSPRGRTSAVDQVLGSVTTRVLERVDVPVLVARTE